MMEFAPLTPAGLALMALLIAFLIDHERDWNSWFKRKAHKLYHRFAKRP